MALLLLDSDSDPDDRHLLVDWKAHHHSCTSNPPATGISAHLPSHGGQPPNLFSLPTGSLPSVVCLDSDSDGDPPTTFISTTKTTDQSYNLASHDGRVKDTLNNSPRLEILLTQESVCVNDSQELSVSDLEPDRTRRKLTPVGDDSPSKETCQAKGSRKTKDPQERQKTLEEKERARQEKLYQRTLQKQLKEEEKKRIQEEKKKVREEEKLRKAEVKARAKESKKVEQEKEKWDKGKFAIQNMKVLIDCEVLENGLIGGSLLNRLAEKDYKYNILSNPVKKSIMWKMKRPCIEDSQTSVASSQTDEGDKCPQLSFEDVHMPYILLVFEAEDFVNMVAKDLFHSHICKVQDCYRGFTICYLVNKLKWYLHKREQHEYKNGGNGWLRPNVEKALAALITHYSCVHSRLSLDEADAADHIVTLTRSLIDCQFKPRLTYLSVSKNGDHVAKGDPQKEVIKNSMWLKALVALPKVSGACAIAIARKYSSMRALLNAYLEPSLTVYEKEMLLQNLVKESSLGSSNEVGRRVGPACSRRIYRIFMAQRGNLKTEDVEDGADRFDA